MNNIYIGVGSNKDAERHLNNAYQKLKSFCSNVQSSPIYKSEAHGFDSDDFYNAVFCCDSELSYNEFNARLKEIEFENGRRKPASKYGVTLDLDILLYGDLCCEGMRLPREDIYKYDFVLKPLVDLAPNYVLPDTQKTVQMLWNERRNDIYVNKLKKLTSNHKF